MCACAYGCESVKCESERDMIYGQLRRTGEKKTKLEWDKEKSFIFF